MKTILTILFFAITASAQAQAYCTTSCMGGTSLTGTSQMPPVCTTICN